MAANDKYNTIKESTISAFFSKLKAAFWPKADVVSITLGQAAVKDVDNAVTKTSTNLVESGGVYSFVKPQVQGSQPVGGMQPGILYVLGTLTGAVTFSLASPTDALIENDYDFTFDSGSPAVLPTWPNGLTWGGNCLKNGVPDIKASKHYEVSIRNNYAVIIEF